MKYLDGQYSSLKLFLKTSRLIENKQLKYVLFFKVYIWLFQDSSKKVKNVSIRFLNGLEEENLVVNNKDNRMFMSRNHPPNTCFTLF